MNDYLSPESQRQAGKPAVDLSEFGRINDKCFIAKVLNSLED